MKKQLKTVFSSLWTPVALIDFIFIINDRAPNLVKYYTGIRRFSRMQKITSVGSRFPPLLKIPPHYVKN